MVGVLSVRPIWRMVIVTPPTPKRREQREASPSGGRCAAARLHHDQHADEAERDRAPAVAPDRLAEDQRREHHREERRGEADRRRFGQRQQGERAKASTMVVRPIAPRAEMGERPLRPPGAEIAGQRDPEQQRRQAEGEAVEGQLGQC